MLFFPASHIMHGIQQGWGANGNAQIHCSQKFTKNRNIFSGALGNYKWDQVQIIKKNRGNLLNFCHLSADQLLWPSEF
jgi:hypothetical protein